MSQIEYGEGACRDGAGYIFDISVMVSHPTLRADELTREFGMEPKNSWSVGDVCATPDGKIFPGIRSGTYWNYSEEIRDKRDFSLALMEFFARAFESRSGFVGELVDSGGEILLLVYLHGSTNIGAVIKPADLARLAQLRVSLGIEVFP